jgi:hypothetical protein
MREWKRCEVSVNGRRERVGKVERMEMRISFGKAPIPVDCTTILSFLYIPKSREKQRHNAGEWRVSARRESIYIEW